MSSDRPGIGLRASTTYIWRASDSLGTGAFGQVFKGHNKKTGDEVAIKTFKSNARCYSPAYLQQHEREFAILKTLDHPNIIRLIATEYELGQNSNPASLVIVMELATEGSLHSEIEKSENSFGLDDKNFLRVLSHLVSGLSYLRQNHNISHRDVKPSNILKTVTNDGQILYKLCDFGTARVIEDDEEFRSIVGTEEYLHPDIYNRAMLGGGPSHFSNNCDLWSVGVTLYQSATGVLPFRPYGGQRANRLEMSQMITSKPPNSFSGIQSYHHGPVEYSEELPQTCRLSIGLRPLIEKILVALFQLDNTKQWAWDQFFRECEHVIRSRPIYCFNVAKATPFVVYRATSMGLLEKEIKRQTGFEKEQQRLCFLSTTGNSFILDDMNILSTETNYDRPLLVFSVNVETQALAQQMLPIQPRIVQDLDVDSDLDSVKSICNLACLIYRKTEQFMHSRSLLSQCLVDLKELVNRELSKTEESIKKTSLLWKFVKDQIDSLGSCDRLSDERRAHLSRKVASAEQISRDISQVQNDLITIRTKIISLNCDKSDVSTESTELESLNQSLKILTDIFQSFRKDRAMRIDMQQSQRDVNAVPWHNLLKVQLGQRWKIVQKSLLGEEFRLLQLDHTRLLPEYRKLIEANTKLIRVETNLKNCDDMVNAFECALQQVVQEHIEKDESELSRSAIQSNSVQQTPISNGMKSDSMPISQTRFFETVNIISDLRGLSHTNSTLLEQWTKRK